MITLDSVTKVYADGHVAVRDLSLTIPAGDVAVLVGPSGCGKTTTMRMINRLLDPTYGRVLIDGRDTATVDPVQLRRSIGYVIQQVGLFGHQTVRRNIATVPILLGWRADRVRRRVDELLDLVGLPPDTYGDRYPHQLSGGQRQRVGVARALAIDPPILLMDEPFGAVDPIERARLQQEMRQLLIDGDTTVVLVTHDIDEAVRLGDRIAVVGPTGRLEQFASPLEILGRPATPFVAEFVGSDRLVKLLAVTAIDRHRLQPLHPDDAAAPQLPMTATLREVLAAVLDSATGRVRIADAGVLTMAGVRETVHSAIAEG